MKNIIQLLFTFLAFGINAQSLKSDTLSEKTTDIETVIINDKDYEKIDYSFALKKEINSRLKIGGPPSSYEIGLEFKNNLGQGGRISDVTLFLHKTDSDYKLVDLEINFYGLDSLTGKPNKKLNTQQIIYSPKNKKRGEVKINVENFHIPFPKEGAFVSVRWLYDDTKDRNVGPSVRLTEYTERLTRTRYDENIGWGSGFNLSSKIGKYTNVMIGLGVYIKKKKQRYE